MIEVWAHLFQLSQVNPVIRLMKASNGSGMQLCIKNTKLNL